MKKIIFLVSGVFVFLVQTYSQALPGASPAFGITVAGGNGRSTLNVADQLTTDLFLDASGNIYIADSTFTTILKYAPGQAQGTVVAGGNGRGNAANQLARATHLFVDPAGNIYITDQSNNRIQKWAPGATEGVTVAGGSFGVGPGQLNQPAGIFVDANGNLYIADRSNERVQKWAPGALTGVTVAGGTQGSGAAQLHGPSSLFLDNAGNIYIGDGYNARVQKWAPGASEGVTVAGGNLSGAAANQLRSDLDIFVTSNGDIYIADGSNSRIQKWTPNSSEGITIAGLTAADITVPGLFFPKGIFVDASGNVFVAEGYNHNQRVQKWAPNNPKGVIVLGSIFPPPANELAYPSGIFVDPTGNVYVADQENYRIQKWAPGAREGVTVAGISGSPGRAANQLASPTGVFVDASGNVFVTDRDNGRVQKWAPGASQGVIVAGSDTFANRAKTLSDPTSSFVDSKGNVFVADSRNDRIQKWAPGATEGVTVAGFTLFDVYYPVSVFLDADENMYINVLGGSQIRKYTPDGLNYVRVAGGKGNGPAADQLYNPMAIFVDAASNLYIADQGNHRIQKWAPGAVEGVTVAGGNGPGNAPNQLNGPTGVFVDLAGDIYVSDSYNNRVQKFGDNVVAPVYCLPNLVVAAPSCTKRATVSWTLPSDTFPFGIKTPQLPGVGPGSLVFIGENKQHGYYRSTTRVLWQTANEISGSLGPNGHLAIINSQEENDLIYDQIKNSGYSPWIGLHNTGREGRFRWVNGKRPSFTNWIEGEPNNAQGSTRNITEPYVRMTDRGGAWNDQPDDYLPFIVEFDKPLIRNRQISGPRNGSRQKPGVYTVCYEIKDLSTDRSDTCCFTVTVTCDSTLLSEANLTAASSMAAAEAGNQGLKVTTAPNPTRHTFRLNITSDNHEKITLQVTDALGRLVETRNTLASGQPVVIGAGYAPGIYFAQVIQGNKRQTIILQKQSK